MRPPVALRALSLSTEEAAGLKVVQRHVLAVGRHEFGMASVLDAPLLGSRALDARAPATTETRPG